MEWNGIALLSIVILLAGCTQPTDNYQEGRAAPTAQTSASAQAYASPTISLQPSAATVVSIKNVSTVKNESEALKLEEYDGKFFSIRKPEGWGIAIGGACSTFSFVIIDKASPQRQVFYFGEIGPVYLDESQKQLDRQYMDMGGFPIQWYGMPVVKPLTAENFLKSHDALAQAAFLKQFMAELPEMREVEIISSKEGKSAVAGDTKLMRALFRNGNKLGEGLFFVTVAEVLPLSGYASGGIGYGFTYMGISAKKEEFMGMEPKLLESLGSLSISESYVANCLQQQQKTTEGILKAGKTLSETSDLIMESWENRNRVDDIISEKRSDAILGNERVYDPDTGTVYGVDNGFYDGYNSNREKYQMGNLQKLPDNDWNLWTSPTEDGSKIQ